MPVTIRHGWRTRVRELIAATATFAAGVVAASAGAGIAVRTVGAVLFVGGTYLVLDGLVLASSWRLTPRAMRIPTIISRRREISGDSGLIVTPAGRWVGAVVVSGERGRRVMTVNPLVSPTDLRRWFAEIADDEREP
jgi:hypothetical protein